jgi:hypothetical protein
VQVDKFEKLKLQNEREKNYLKCRIKNFFIEIGKSIRRCNFAK